MNNRYGKIFIALLAVGMATSLAACGAAEQETAPAPEEISEAVTEPAQTDMAESGSGSETEAEQIEIELAFGDTVMTAALDDSETSRAFIEMLPLTLTINGTHWYEKQYGSWIACNNPEQ